MFPELEWLSTYLTHLHSLQYDRDRLNQAIAAITEEGEVYHDYWIEPYTKIKNGKHYTYHQLRWLTGERKTSGQPKVKTKHLSHLAVAEVQAARASRYPQGVDRGVQVEALEQERQQVDAKIERLRHLVQGTDRRLQRVISQNITPQGGQP